MNASHDARWLPCFLSLPLAFAVMWSGTVVRAQDAPADSPAAPKGATLELPVLVVDHEHRPVDGVTLDQLKIKTGGGAPFAPLAMRREGEDPLSLAIVIDASRDSFHDLIKLDGELSSLVGTQILPNDRISVYALDCAMTRSLTNAPPDAATLHKAIDDALNLPTLHEGKAHSSCGKTVHLWDDIAAVVAALSHTPGRRAILLISSGSDGGSKYDWLTVEGYAFDQGVAIFALRDQRQSKADDYTQTSMSAQNGAAAFHSVIAPTLAPRAANNLELLCANDGGLTLSSAPEFRKDGLADILFLMRNRFILTIPKDLYQPGNSHSAKVTQSGLSAFFMSSTGATEPMVK